MADAKALVYFFGDWPEDERSTITDAALAVTPDHVRRAWNERLGHLWAVVRREDGRLFARMGAAEVEAETAEVLAERVRATDWSRGTEAWSSGRSDRRFGS